MDQQTAITQLTNLLQTNTLNAEQPTQTITPQKDSVSEICEKLDSLLQGLQSSSQPEQATSATSSNDHFDLSKPICATELQEISDYCLSLSDKIEEVKSKIDSANQAINYDTTLYTNYNYSAMRQKYRDKAKKTIFSPSKKLERLKRSNKFFKDQYEARLADKKENEERKKTQEKEKEQAEIQLPNLQHELSTLENLMEYYRPLYDKYIYWAQEAKRAFWDKEGYGSMPLIQIATYISKRLYSTDTDTSENLLEKATKRLIEFEDQLHTEKLIIAADKAMQEAIETAKRYHWGDF